MPRLIALLSILLFLLAGCGQDLHFKISYDDIGSLAVGDPVVTDGQAIGKVTGLEETNAGLHLVDVAIPLESAGVATSEASFVLAIDPEKPQRRRIEVVLSGPGGKPITEGSVVRGSYASPLGSLFPFGQILKEMGGALRSLSDQVQQFRQEFQKLPDSPETKQMLNEWRRLMEEIAKTQNQAGETLNKEILPKLEKQMQDLQKRLEEAQKGAAKKPREI